MTRLRQIRTRLAAAFDTPFARRQRAIAARIAELRALPDEALAELGLPRSGIIAHVFATHAAARPDFGSRHSPARA